MLMYKNVRALKKVKGTVAAYSTRHKFVSQKKKKQDINSGNIFFFLFLFIFNTCKLGYNKVPHVININMMS